MQKFDSPSEYWESKTPKPGEWETVDPTALFPAERERLITDSGDFRIFFGPGHTAHEDLPWVLVVREKGIGGVMCHVHHGQYRNEQAAKHAAVHLWGAPAD